jgi:uncharacterized protein YuzE
VDETMNIHYSEEADVLTVEDETYEGFDHSLELGDLMIDLDTDGGCLGLVIEGASDRTGLDPSTLATVEQVDVTVDGDDEAPRITAVLHHEDGRTTVKGGRREEGNRVKGRDV